MSDLFNKPMGRMLAAARNGGEESREQFFSASDWQRLWFDLERVFALGGHVHPGLLVGGSWVKGALLRCIARAATDEQRALAARVGTLAYLQIRFADAVCVASPDGVRSDVAGDLNAPRVASANAQARKRPLGLARFESLSPTARMRTLVERCDSMCYRRYIAAAESIAFLRSLLLACARELGLSGEFCLFIQHSRGHYSEPRSNPFPHTLNELVVDARRPLVDRVALALGEGASPRRLSLLFAPAAGRAYTQQQVQETLPLVLAAFRHDFSLAARRLALARPRARGGLRWLIGEWLRLLPEAAVTTPGATVNANAAANAATTVLPHGEKT